VGKPEGMQAPETPRATSPEPVHPPTEGSHLAADGVVEHPAADDFGHARILPTEPNWFQRAVFYEVLVRAFYDHNADGSGDLQGLILRLDYLAWLGVDCIWLPPFYDSPLRDGGYDIRDFYKVLPDFGTVDDFVALLDEAHKRGIRVITDLVMNHTSDQHPWFQASRRDPRGPYGDFYVWSETDQLYLDARIIFVDTEESNWTFDPVRRQFYWHRFFSHQPDLNYDNPEVQQEMLNVIRFWLDLGIDGFRLDAVPYLFEREGTNCENLPETHEFLKRCRKVVDDEFPGRVLLAEANQWPSDVVAYFGDPAVGGDECHMAFHFPLMPRIFMAVRRESRIPISEVLAHTPPIPANCQWGIFLRNHDELTLEMVTDEERDYMYSEYAEDPRMRANVGIRRRLAALLENDRDQFELFTALLLSLPGAPVLYYGDEIGMGDNIWLGDRDGVRTPMQWTPDRNAGFSRANPGRIYVPPVQDPVFGFQAVNVEAQRDSSATLLNWTRTMLAVRRRHEAFALGDFLDLGGSNPSVFAFLRVHGEDVVLCVHNLSRFPQAVELELPDWAGYTPVELTGRVPFPRIGEHPYLLTLPGHSFYWFRLSHQHQTPAATGGEAPRSGGRPLSPQEAP
jgi:maltose alpha-D-glucosyltransferase / alpha-amylase